MSVMSLSLLACSGDDDNYSPGEEVSANCPNVYFASDNETTTYLDPETISENPDHTWTQAIKLVRADSVGALTVDIVVDKKSEGVEVPSTVTFNDGEKTASLLISYTHPDKGLSASIHVGDDYVNPYVVKEGSISFNYSVAVLEKVCSVTFSSAQKRSEKNTSLFANVTNEIYNCKGLNKFLWKNFLGSGISPFFEIIPKTGTVFDADNVQNNEGEIHFLDHVNDYYGYGYVFLMTDNGEWPTWTPEGQSTEVTFFYMYDYAYSMYSGYYGIYDLIDLKPRTDEWYSGYIGNGLSKDGGTSWSRDGYGYIYFFFDYDDANN